MPKPTKPEPVTPLPTDKTAPLPSPPARLARPRSALSTMMGGHGPVSTVHFLVHVNMPEVRALLDSQGWRERGFTRLSVQWLELKWTADGWKTIHTVSSNDVPCPVVNGTFHLAHCAAGTEVEFAIHAGIACHAEHDTAGARGVADLWFNNAGRNYTQVTK